MDKKGFLVVISAPSGTGKSSLAKLLRDMDSSVRMSVSATTREPRDGERDGENYFFKTPEEFKSMIEKGELLEWVSYCDNYYGTPVKYLDDMIEKGYTVVLDIDVEGAASIRDRYPDSVLIFVLPPSFKELERRIAKRGSESEDSLQKRLDRAKNEVLHLERFDYVVVNDSLETASNNIYSIIKAERHTVKRNKDILQNIGG
jgi:guanylate kinase